MPGKNNRVDFQVAFKTDQASVNAVRKSLQEIGKVKLTSFKGTKDELQQVKLTARQVGQALQKAFNPNLKTLNVSSFKQQLQTAGLSIDQMYQQFSKAGAAGQNAFRDVTRSVLTTNLQLKETKSLVNAMGETMANTIKWGIASSVMNTFTNSVRQAFQYAKSLDGALTDIRIVTGDSTDQMRQFAQEANKAAQTLGRSTMDYTKAALTFYQQGLSDEEVRTRTETVLKAQNITGAGQEMADYLTAVWNGYKVANEEAELYVDKLAAVADSSASNMSQLAVAMSKVAATANALGVPVDSLNAQIATITATTRQAPETVGNALKTIYARINDIKTGADDAQVSLGNYSGIMASLGFNVLDANGALKDTGITLTQIGEKWSTLSREQQIYLARTMAGQRQYNNLIALFDNWSKYSDLLNVSMEAQGTTMEKNSRYMDSLEAKLEQLGAASQRVKDALINEEDLKGLASFGTNIVNLLGSMVESIGGGRGVLLALGSTITSVFGNVLAKELTNAITNFQKVRSNAQQLRQEIQNTEQFGRSQGYSDGLIKSIVDAKKEGQKYYQAMTNEQIKAYNAVVDQIGAHQNVLNKINEQVQGIEKFKSSVEETANNLGNNYSAQIELVLGKSLQLKESLKDLKLGDLNDSGTLQELIDKVTQLRDAAGTEAVPAFNQFNEALKNIDVTGSNSINSLAALKQAAQAALSQVNNQLASDLEATKSKATQAQQALRRVKSTRDEMIASAQTASFSQNLVAYASSLTQILMVANNISNVFKILKNDSLSTGEKFRQTLLNVSMSIIAIVSALNKISKATGIQQALAQRKATLVAIERNQQERITRQKEKQLLLDKKAILEKQKQLLGKARPGAGRDKLLDANAKKLKAVNDALAENAKASADGAKEAKVLAGQLDNLGSKGSIIAGTLKTKLTAGLNGLVTTMGKVGSALLTPWGLIAAAVVTATVIIYRQLTKAQREYQKAKKQADQAKDIYTKIREQVKDLNSSFDNLKSAKERLSELTSGTDQWNNALQDVNDQVLDLIEKFPELNKFLTSDNNGMLTFEEGAQQQIKKIYRERQTAAALNYSSANQQSAEAKNNYLITEESRKLDGLGGVTPQILSEVVDAINKHGSVILENEDSLKQALGDNVKISQDQIKTILDQKKSVNDLAKQIKSNTIQSKNLSQAMIKGTFSEYKEYQNSQNKDTLAALANQYLQQAQLDTNKYFKDYSTTATAQAAGSPAKVKIFDAESLAAAYQEYTGQQARATKFGKIQVYNEESKKFEKISTQTVKSYVAHYQAMQNAGEYLSKANQTIKKWGPELAGIYSKFSGDLVDAENLSKNDIEKISQNKEFAKQLQNLLGYEDTEKGNEDFQNFINNLKESSVKNTQQYARGLENSVERAFNKLDTDKLTPALQEKLGGILTDVFVEGEGFQNFQDSIADLFSQAINEDKLTDLLDLDLSNMGVQEFKTALEGLGLEVPKSDKALQAFLNTCKNFQDLNPQQTYKSIHDIIDKLKTGDTITAQQGATLENAGIALEGFFSRWADGTLKLESDAEEFYEYANNKSLDPFKAKIQQLANEVGGRSQFEQTSSYSASNGGNFEQFSKSAYSQSKWGDQVYYSSVNNEKLVQQIEYLKAIQVEDAAIAEAISAINGGHEVSKETVDKIGKLVGQNYDGWIGNKDAIEAGVKQLGIYQEQLQNTTQLVRGLDPDVKQEDWKALTQYLTEYADKLEDVDDGLKDDKKAAAALAQQMLRYNHALEQVSKNYDNWTQALSSGSVVEATQAGAELRNVYSDLLDLPFESLSPDFTQSVTNLQLLKEAANGSEQAYNQLMTAAQQDIIAHCELDTEEFNQAYNNVQQLMETYNFEDIEIGASLDDSAFLAELTNMVNAAHMTAEQATDYLASMGIDAKIKQNRVSTDQTQEVSQLIAEPEPVQVPYFYTSFDGTSFRHWSGNQTIPGYRYKPSYKTVTGSKQSAGFTLQVESAHKKSGGKFNYQKANNARKPSKGGGGGGGGGSGSPKKATIAKTSNSAAKIKVQDIVKQPDHNPYQQTEKAYQRQSDILDKLQDQQKNLTNKDRLKNLREQNKVLEKQRDILKQELQISDDFGQKNTTAYWRKQLEDLYGQGNISFDEDKQISDKNALEKASAERHNQAAISALNSYQQFEKDYNDWIENVWNKYSGDQQEQYKAEKEKRDEALKQAEEDYKEALKAAEKRYKDEEQARKNYQKAWEEDLKREKELADLERQIYENHVAKFELRLQLKVDAGDLYRQLNEFNKKVVERIKDDDFAGQTRYLFKDISSYIDSGQLEKRNAQIEKLNRIMDSLKKGGKNEEFGYGKEGIGRVQAELQKLEEEQMKALEELVSLQEEAYDNYLDAIDKANDKIEDQIDEYSRINDLIDHNTRLIELIYGDKSYKAMDNYYEMQKANNMRNLQDLVNYRNYWKEMMDKEVAGSEAWQKYKENFENATDQINSKLEQMIENLATQLQARLKNVVDQLNNTITGGRGLDFIDQEWDAIDLYDQHFLDPVESKMGVKELTDLYQQAIDGLDGNPAQQQKMNKLMNDQLKLLREKDKLTQYDIDRAKAALEVEKARIALEEARENKTKMRLRRDSQGNYTYQYVADQEKLTDLQSALSEAEANLYNMDKEHYKQNLNDLYNTYKDYIEKRQELLQQLAKAQASNDQAEVDRLNKRIGLLDQTYTDLYNNLSEEQRYAYEYLTSSTQQALGVDWSGLSPEEVQKNMKEIVRYVQSSINDLNEYIKGSGGLAEATKESFKVMQQQIDSYAQQVEETLNVVGTNVTDIMNGEDQFLKENLEVANEFLDRNEKIIESCQKEIETVQNLIKAIDDLLTHKISLSEFVNNINAGYNTLQKSYGSDMRAEDIPLADQTVSTTNPNSAKSSSTGTSGVGSGLKNSITAAMATDYNSFLSSNLETNMANVGYSIAQMALNREAQMQTLSQAFSDNQRIINAVNDSIVLDMMKLQQDATLQITGLLQQGLGYLADIATSSRGLLEQSVTITANFPNVASKEDIKQAFDELRRDAAIQLSNVASQSVSSQFGT